MTSSGDPQAAAPAARSGQSEGRKTDRILKIGQKVREMNEAVAALILGTPGEEAF